MTKAAILADINSNIFQNAKKAITGNSLRRILKELLDFASDVNPLIAQDTADRSHTGDNVETILGAPLLIPADTMGANGFMKIEALLYKIGTAGNANIKLYFNTVDDLSGSPIPIAQNLMTASVLVSGFSRRIVNKGSPDLNNIFTANFSTGVDYGGNIAARTSLNVDFSVDQYLIVTAELVNAADEAGYDNVNILVWNV